MRAVSVGLVLLLGAGGMHPAGAQTPGPSPSPSSTRPTSSPQPSGQQPAGNPFLGGVPTGTPTAETLSLSVADAINRALEHNLGVLNAEEAVTRAHGARWLALSGLLPQVSARVSETRQVINLASFGFSGFGTAFADVPTLVGPFNVFDARAFVSQPVFDLGAINGARSEAHNESAARYSLRSARDLVVLVAANMYLQALAASARAASAKAQLETAQALYNQAVDLKQSGLVAGIDVLRAEVELNAEQQRTTATANDFEKAKLALARVIGLPPGQPFSLRDQLPDAPVPEMTLENALDRAYRTRPDYQAALERVRAAEATRASIAGEALPSVRVDANVGEIGLTLGDARGTYSLSGGVTVPIFQGGRQRGRLLQADADIRDRQAEAADLKAGIYYDVRTAFLDLQASGEQLQVAVKARDLAAQQLEQARDRFAAGVANNIEVVQAQQAVTLANEQYIAALYGYNLAKAALARGLGVAEDALRQFLGGSR